MKKPMPVLSQTIRLNGREISYTWARKPIKNINLRVRADGSVAVSSPIGTAEKVIRDFLFEHADFLLSALQKFEARRTGLPPENSFQTGDQLLIFGARVPIKVVSGKRSGGSLTSDGLILTVPDTDDKAKRRHAAELWAKKALEQKIAAFCKQAETDFERFLIPRPVIKLRKMRSRWGSCNTKKAILTFNTSLIGAPLAAIEYVVYHEFAHLIHPDHSRQFYALVADFLPDWKTRRSLLRNIPSAIF